jgi:hypothetical protein
VRSFEHGAEAQRVDQVADGGADSERDQLGGDRPIPDGRPHVHGPGREQRGNQGAPEGPVGGGHDNGHPRSVPALTRSKARRRGAPPGRMHP